MPRLSTPAIAHSFEVWNKAGELVAGGYGVAIGGSFTAESQFTHESNASRIGMTVLNWHLARWGYRFNDGKLIGPLWENMGFRDVPRHEFLALLAAGDQGAGQERPLAGRNRHGNRVALAAGLTRPAYGRPLSITLPISGIFAIQRRTRDRWSFASAAATLGRIGNRAGGTG